MVDVDDTALFLVDVDQTALFQLVDTHRRVDNRRRPFFRLFHHALSVQNKLQKALKGAAGSEHRIQSTD